MSCRAGAQGWSEHLQGSRVVCHVAWLANAAPPPDHGCSASHIRSLRRRRKASSSVHCRAEAPAPPPGPVGSRQPRRSRALCVWAR